MEYLGRALLCTICEGAVVECLVRRFCLISGRSCCGISGGGVFVEYLKRAFLWNIWRGRSYGISGWGVVVEYLEGALLKNILNGRCCGPSSSGVCVEHL